MSPQYSEGHFHYVCPRCEEPRCTGVFGAWSELRFPIGVPQDIRPYCGACFARELKSGAEVLKPRDLGMPGKYSVN